MTWRLRTQLYGAYAAGGYEITPAAGGHRFRAALPGGLQTFDFLVGWDQLDAVRACFDHLGKYVFVTDNLTPVPVAHGIVGDFQIEDRGLRVSALGPWQAYLFREVYNDTSTWVSSGTTSAQVIDILDDSVPGISDDRSHIEETSTDHYPWQTADNLYPGDHIERLAALSDSANNRWLFWLDSGSISGGGINSPPVPWFSPSIPNHQRFSCSRRDIAVGGMRTGRSLRKLANDIQVGFVNAAHHHSQTGSASSSESQTLYGLWERWNYDLGRASLTAAQQYRDLLLDKFEEPQQYASFRIDTFLRYGMNYGVGAEMPLWFAIRYFPFYLSVTDMLPGEQVLAGLEDAKRTFLIVAADYDYARNVLTVTPDIEDHRADAMLSRYRGMQ